MLCNGLKSLKQTQSFQYTSANRKIIQRDLNRWLTSVCREGAIMYKPAAQVLPHL